VPESTGLAGRWLSDLDEMKLAYIRKTKRLASFSRRLTCCREATATFNKRGIAANLYLYGTPGGRAPFEKAKEGALDVLMCGDPAMNHNAERAFRRPKRPAGVAIRPATGFL